MGKEYKKQAVKIEQAAFFNQEILDRIRYCRPLK